MVFGPLYVLFCSFIIIRSVKGTLKPNIQLTIEKYESQSQSNESDVPSPKNNRPSDVSLISIDFEQEHQRSYTIYSKHSAKTQRSKSSHIWSDASSKKTSSTSSLISFSFHPQWFIYFFRYIASAIYLYRRIIFLIVVSLLSLCSAIIIANTILNLDSFTQENFYNCVLRTTAFRIYPSSEDYINKCGGYSKRISITWKMFTLQLYMISFGIGPYFAFGTTQHSIDFSFFRSKLGLFFGSFLRFMNRFFCCICFKSEINQEPEKIFRSTDRLESLSADESRRTRKTDDFSPAGMLSESSDIVTFSPFEGQLFDNAKAALNRRSFGITGGNCSDIQEDVES